MTSPSDQKDGQKHRERSRGWMEGVWFVQSPLPSCGWLLSPWGFSGLKSGRCVCAPVSRQKVVLLYPTVRPWANYLHGVVGQSKK